MHNYPVDAENNRNQAFSGLRRTLSILVLPAAFTYLEWMLGHGCDMGEGYRLQTALLAGFAFGLLCDIPVFAFRKKAPALPPL